MDRLASRRQFLHTSSLAGVGLVGHALSVRPAAAIEPIERLDGPKFKFSLAAYGYRDLLKGNPAKLTLSDFVRDCAKMNLDATELTSYYFPDPVSDDYLRSLKAECFRLGLDVSGTAVGNDFCHPPGAKRDEQIAYVKKWVDHAVTMGAPVIRIFSGHTRDGQSPAEAHRLAVDAIETCCDYAGRHGVFLALENHGGLTAQVESMLSIIRDVQSPWFGVNLDTGNFYSNDVYAELSKIAPYAVNVQVKVSIKPANQQRQPSDFKRLAGILRAAGYRGYIVLEFEEKEDPRTACPRYIDQLREAFA
ncbi:MAG: sugar phosphate isomerase/epimerase family protein [Pirellulales bacterium]